jgi:hypothetical protein
VHSLTYDVDFLVFLLGLHQEPEKAFQWWCQLKWGNIILFYGFPWKVNTLVPELQDDGTSIRRSFMYRMGMDEEDINDLFASLNAPSCLLSCMGCSPRVGKGGGSDLEEGLLTAERREAPKSEKIDRLPEPVRTLNTAEDGAADAEDTSPTEKKKGGWGSSLGSALSKKIGTDIGQNNDLGSPAPIDTVTMSIKDAKALQQEGEGKVGPAPIDTVTMSIQDAKALQQGK